MYVIYKYRISNENLFRLWVWIIWTLRLLQGLFEGVCFEYTHVIPGPGAKTVALTSDPETRNGQELQSGQKK